MLSSPLLASSSKAITQENPEKKKVHFFTAANESIL
jgi:hypothetical protein